MRGTLATKASVKSGLSVAPQTLFSRHTTTLSPSKVQNGGKSTSNSVLAATETSNLLSTFTSAMTNLRRNLSTSTSTTTSSTSSPATPSPSSPKPSATYPLLSVLVPGKIIDGFEVISAREHTDFNLVMYTLKHLRSGAEYVHLERKDSDNAFCVAFRTMPRSDNGVAHILEHTVLCGSQKYPVRDPFFLLMSRSLATFMNAITRPEATYYPFSTQNPRDFENLLSVYLDAVFFPLLNKLDFRQEGHRLEVKRGDDDVEAEGEMDGSDSENEIAKQKSGRTSRKNTVIHVGNDQIDMAEGMEEEDDPMLAMKIIEEFGMDPMNMSEEDLNKVSAELQQRLMDTMGADQIYSDGEGAESEVEVDMSLSAKDMGVHTGGMPEAAYRAIELAQKQEQEESEKKKGASASKSTTTSASAATDATAVENTPTEAVSGADVEAVDYSTCPLTFKGVVFNEMKGALSDPQTLFVTELERHLYQSSIYRNNSGGDPLAITSLTHAELIEFHKYHYHPSNACFMTYGDALPRLKEVDEVINRRLDLLKAEAEAKKEADTKANKEDKKDNVEVERKMPMEGDIPPAFTVAEVPHILAEKQRFTAPKAVTAAGPISANGDASRKNKFAFSWLCKPEIITDLQSPSLISGKVDISEIVKVYPFRGAALEGAELEDAPQTPFSGAEKPLVDSGENIPATFEEWFNKEVSQSIESVREYNSLAKSSGNNEANPEIQDSEPVEEEPLPDPTLPLPTSTLSDITHFASLSPHEQHELNQSFEEASLSLLGSLLFENPYSPVYHVLTDPSLGQTVAPTTGCDTFGYEPHISVGLVGVPEGQVDAVANKLIDALYSVAMTGEGLGKAQVLAILHQVEFALKDVQKSFGVHLLQRLVGPVAQHKHLHAQLDAIRYLYRLRESVERYGSTYFRALLMHHVLSNPHRLLFVLREKAEYNKMLKEQEQQQLDVLRKELSAEEVKKIDEEAALLSQRQENKGDVSCLPSLSITDIRKNAPVYKFPTALQFGNIALPTPSCPVIRKANANPFSEKNIKNNLSGTPETGLPEKDAIFPTPGLARPVTANIQPTNGIVVVRAIIDDVADRLTPYQLSLLPYVSLLFGKLGAGERDYKEHTHAIEMFTGGISIGFQNETVRQRDGTYKYELQAILTGKALVRNTDTMARLLIDTICRPNLTEHVYNTLSQYAGGLSTALQENGFRYAQLDAQARVPGNVGGIVDHYTAGLPHLRSANALFARILAETTTIENSGGDVATMDGKPIPPGVSVSPTLMRLACDVAETMRCLVLGPAHMQMTLTKQGKGDIDYIPPPLTNSTYDTSKAPLLPEVVSSAPHAHAPAFSSRGFSRVIVTADVASLRDSNTTTAVEHIVNSGYCVSPVAYHASASAVATYLQYNTARDYTPCEALTPKRIRGDADQWAALASEEEKVKMMMDSISVAPVAQVRNQFGVDVGCDVEFTTVRQWLEEMNQSNNAINTNTNTSTSTAGKSNDGSKVPLVPPHLRPYNYIAVPVQVNNVVLAMPTVPHTHPDCPVLMLLSEVISDGFLHGQVREKGGAYGAFSSQNRAGIFTMGSYRDPRCVETIESFRQAIDWAQRDDTYDEQKLNEAKLTLFANIDSPETPSSAGVYAYLRLATQEERQAFRDRLLTCTVEDLRRVARTHLSFNRGRVSVVGSGEHVPESIEKDAATPNGKWQITIMG